MPRPSRNDVLRYGSAVLGVGLATAARLALDPLLGDLFPFATLFLAVLVVAGRGGRGPALLATALGALVSARFLLPPRGSFDLQGIENKAGLVLYLTIGLGIALLGGALRDARRRSEAVADEAVRRREELRITLSSIGDAVIVTDAEGRVTSLNPVAEVLTGWSGSEASGEPLPSVFRIIGEETRRPAEDPALRALREGAVVGLANHTLLIARDGTERPIDDSAAPIRDPSGRIIGVVLVFRDVGDRKRAEAEARRSGERARTILESITDAFFALDRDWRFTYVNRQAEALLGRDRGDLIGKRLWDEYPETVGTDIERQYRRAMGGGVAVEFDDFYPPHDRWYENHLYPSEDGLAVYFRDITGRKRAEEEHARLVAASDQRRRIYETALSNGPDFSYVFDLEGRFTFVNAPLLALWRKSLDEAVGKDFLGLDYPPDLADHLLRQIAQVVDTKETVRDEAPFTSHLGERRYEYIFAPVLGADGAVEAVTGSTRDVTERKQAEEALRERERFIHRILDASPGIVYVFDLEDRRTVFINEGVRGTIGVAPGEVEAAGGRFLAERVHPDDLPGLDDHLARISSLADGDVLATEYRMRHADGRWLWFSGRDTVFQRAPDGRPRQVLGVASDVTDRKQAEDRLRDSEGRFRSMAESIPQLAWMARPDGHIYWYNRRWHEYTGTTPEQMEGWGWQDVHDPDVLPGVLERWRGSIASGEPFDMVFPLKGADGRFRPFLTRVAPVRGRTAASRIGSARTPTSPTACGSRTS